MAAAGSPDGAYTAPRAVTINYLVWAVAVIVMAVSATTTANLMVLHRMSYLQGLALGLAVDASIAVALIGDGLLQRAGQRSGWGTALRWITAAMSLLLNCAQSFMDGDALGVVLHAIPAVLLISLTEAAQDYQLKLARHSGMNTAACETCQQRGTQDGEQLESSLVPWVPGIGSEPLTVVQNHQGKAALPDDVGSVLADMLVERDDNPQARWGTDKWDQALDCAVKYQQEHNSDVRVDDIQQALSMGRARAADLRRDVLAHLAALKQSDDAESLSPQSKLVLAPLDLILRHAGERLVRMRFTPDPETTKRLRDHLVEATVGGRGTDPLWVGGYALDIRRADDPAAKVLTFSPSAAGW